MKNLRTYIVYAAVGISGILIGALLFSGGSEPQSLDEHIAEAHTNEDGEIIYTCSMHPQIRQSEPGNCPICSMTLIPVDDNSSEADPNSLVMSQAAMQLAEIETSPVIKSTAISTLRLPGKVAVNQRKSSAISSHIPGRIIDLYVDFKGDYIEEGEPVASIYSPELIAAQQELFETAKYKEQNPTLYQSARRKLELWELPLATIDEIEAENMVMESVDIVSPVSGYVQEINVQRQKHVMEGSLMYEVADLSSVWVMFDAFESNVSVLEVGQKLEFTTPSYPGQSFSGTVDYIDPVIQNSSRSLQFRVEADNEDLRLKPNMLVEGILNAQISEADQLLIPTSAVLWTGTRSVVFVQERGTSEPTFSAREITLGERVGDHYIVIEGLQEGELVVTNGAFKLDSAAQLADKLSMMNRNSETNTTQPEPEHEHHMMMMEMAEVNEDFRDQLVLVISEYLELKNNLVQSNPGAVAASAQQVLSSLNALDMELLDGEDHMEWMSEFPALKTSTESILSSSSLEEQRSSFRDLSAQLIETVKYFQIQGVYYEQFCPMTNNGAGAYWLSEQEEIANPYLGEDMSHCGETIVWLEF
ncbi:MAG: efflux RND transporter periplasmic adaptor subunit [Balneola sp.]|nr:MAG: efflux RND transporter periplasmic adaptor subunit [Balneola sp.]